MFKYILFFMGALAMVTGVACTDRSEVSGSPAGADVETAASPAAAATVKPDQEKADPPETPKKPAPKEEKEPVKQPEPAKAEKAPPAGEAAEAPGDPEVEAMKQKIGEKWNKIQSLSAKATTKEEGVQGEERKTTWDGTGTYECKREGDRLLVRMEVDNHMVVPEGTAVVDNYRKILTISDGEYVHNVVEAMRMRRAFKIEADRGAGFEISGPTLLENLKRDNTLKLLPDDVVNGRPAYVVEGVSQKRGQKLLVYLDKEYGILAKMIIEDARKVRTITLGEIKINVEFPDNHFVFTPPPNVEVRDMTKAGQEKARKEAQEQKKAEGQEKGEPAPATPPPPSP
jgi:outer membrane lipoprotein-sorting protein